MKIHPVLLLCFLFVNPLYAQKADFATDSLYLSSGEAYHHGKQDLNGKVKLNSAGDKVVIEIEVADDKTVVKDDPLHTDHVEIWYALPQRKEEKQRIPEALNQPPLYYYTYDTTDKDNKHYRFFSISDKVSYPYEKDQKARVYFGEVHYGIYPDNRKAVMFGKENYTLLENVLGEKVGHIHQGVQYKTETTKTGMKYTVTITPLGLGFVRVPEMTEALFRIDLVDADGEGETVLSTAPGTGDSPSDFNEVSFSRALKTYVTTVPRFVYDTLQFSPAVMFTEKGYWSGVTRDTRCVQRSNDCDIMETVFIRTPFGYKKWFLGKQEVLRFTSNLASLDSASGRIDKVTEDIYFIDKRNYRSRRGGGQTWEFRNLSKEFMFPDKCIGLVLVNVGEPDVKGASLRNMEVVKIQGKEVRPLFLMNEDPGQDVLRIQDRELKSVTVTDARWLKEGETMQVVCEQKEDHAVRRFRVVFSKSGKVTVTEEKERAARPKK